MRIPVSVTMYNAEACQTDNSPLITASNIVVHEKIVAISKDLETRFNLKFGDTIQLEGISGDFVFHDRTHERMSNRPDGQIAPAKTASNPADLASKQPSVAATRVTQCQAQSAIARVPLIRL